MVKKTENGRKISFLAKKKPQKDKIVRITNDNLEEKRDEIIAKGKKFKYPFQYTKHRLVINAILIAVAMLVLFVAYGWFELYQKQNTGDVAFRFTRVLPLSVAKVDGVPVRYSDYLAFYRGSVSATEQQQGNITDTEDGWRILQQYKRQALDMAEESSYAMKKLKDDYGIEIDKHEIDAVIAGHRGEKSNRAFTEIIAANFRLTMGEYRRMVKLSLAKKKLSEKMDLEAQQNVKKVEEILRQNNNNFDVVAQQMGDKVMIEDGGSELSDLNLDGGRMEVAKKLKVGEVSKAFVSKNGDGYYIVLLNSKNNKELQYKSAWVRFKAFNKQMKRIKKSGAVQEYIDIKS